MPDDNKPLATSRPVLSRRRFIGTTIGATFGALTLPLLPARLLAAHPAAGASTAIANDLIQQGLVGEALYCQIHETAPKQVQIAALLEQKPDPDNRVQPDWDKRDAIGLPRPKLTYQFGDYSLQGWQQAHPRFRAILEEVGGTDIEFHEPGGAGHILATHRMGNDAKTSVTDSYGRTHDHANLYLAGGGLFPTVGAANPTLTIVALALRSAQKIGNELGVTVKNMK